MSTNDDKTLTLQSLIDLERRLRAEGVLPPLYELRVSKLPLPQPRTYYVINRKVLDPDNLFPALDRSPLVICAEGDEAMTRYSIERDGLPKGFAAEEKKPESPYKYAFQMSDKWPWGSLV